MASVSICDRSLSGQELHSLSEKNVCGAKVLDFLVVKRVWVIKLFYMKNSAAFL